MGRLAAALLGLVALAGAAETTRAAERPRPPAVLLDQGWSPDLRDLFYFTPQGSRLLPYRLALALERADGDGPFFAARSLAGYGWIAPDGPSARNPDGLPIGFVQDPADRPGSGPQLGLTCAACHTGDLVYGGKRLRIDGGPAQADYQAFMADLSAALDAGLADPRRFDRLAARMAAGNPAARAALAAELSATAAAIRRLNAGNWTAVPYGRGRLDAFGHILNAVAADALALPGNLRSPDAPVSYPFLWTTPRQRYVQWNGVAGNPIGRNAGEVLGVFGAMDLAGGAGGPFASSVLGPELVQLEAWVDALEPPPWPEGILPAIDRAAAARGSQLYETLCAPCHMGEQARRTDPAENAFGKTFLAVTMVRQTDIRTDSRMLDNFHARRAETGVLQRHLGLPAEDDAGRVLVAAVSAIVGRLIPPGEAPAYFGYRLTRPTTPEDKPKPYGGWTDWPAYKAGPLAGVWATGPYLHNGSVPTLYDLLSPEAERPTRFLVGATRFDPFKVGFVSRRFGLTRAERAATTEFDTTRPGNSNRGHAFPETFGRTLSHRERMDLIAFLKTLKAPARSPEDAP